jgi:hypothetical protein
MAGKVKLAAIVEELETIIDESSSYVDRETGEVLSVTDDVLHDADADPEPPDGMPQWQIPMFEAARRIVEDPDRYPQLPDKFEVNEYSIMEKFCGSVQDTRIREELLNAIGGKGAFRYFKDIVSRRKLWDAWNAFRNEALREIARDWCEDQKIEYQ